jgi:hypothetical protein
MVLECLPRGSFIIFDCDGCDEKIHSNYPYIIDNVRLTKCGEVEANLTFVLSQSLVWRLGD